MEHSIIAVKTENPHSVAFDHRVTWHSQPGIEQDRWIVRHMRGRKNGTFLELGAYDGVYHSNTLTLERDFGWTGWLMEAVKEYAEMARRVRHAQVINAAVGPDEAERDFFVGNQWSGLKDFTRSNLLQGHADYRTPIVTVHTTPLATLLRLWKMPPVIDYFSLDVEGAEYPILKSYFNDPPTQFRCLTIEIGNNADHIHELCALLEPMGYQLTDTVAWEAYFIHSELCRG